MSAIPSTESPIKIYYVPTVNAYFFKYSHASRYGPPEDVTTKFRYWADPRPLMPHDIELVLRSSSIPHDVKEIFVKILKQSTTIVNVNNDNVLDMILEFMTNGEVLCSVNYDMFNDRYIAVPGKLGACIMLEYLRYSNVVITDEHCSKVYDIRKKEDYPVFIATTEDGRPCGSALMQDGRIVFVRKWIPTPVEEVLKCVERRKVTPRELYELNLDYIIEREEKVKKVVDYFENKHHRKGILSFSGGKDSLLALCLLLKAGSKTDIIHVRIENADPPPLDRYIDYVERRLGVHIEVLEASWNKTLKYLQELGMPSRGNRWCTPLLKFVNMLSYIKHRYGINAVVSYVGSRKSETIKRSIRPATYIDSEAGLLTHAVCYKFPKLLEYLYIWYREKLELFRDYHIGIERVSCVTCPFKTCHEIKIGIEHYPEVYECWLPFIKKLLRAMVKDETFIENALKVHLWRFYLLHSDAQYIARKAGVKLVDPYIMQLNAISDTISMKYVSKEQDVKKVSLTINIRHRDRLKQLESYVKFFFPECTVYAHEDRIYLKFNDFELNISNSGIIDIVIRSFSNIENFINILKLVYMCLSCVECGHCIYNCPNDAILRTPFTIDFDRCVRCFRCFDACVPARYIFDMIILSELTSIKYARMRIERIRDKYKEILTHMRESSDIEWLRW